MRKKIFTVSLLMCCFQSAFSQTDGLGTWNILNLRKNFNEKWFAFGEAQARSQKMYNDFHYHEYKGGLGYNLGKSFSVVVAAGQYVTYTPTENFDTVLTSEFRFWQQFTLTNNLDRVKIEHRYRTEQRWVNSDYRNRFRYRMSVIVPLNHKKVEKNTVFINVSDEVFFTNKKPFFERNRLFLGTGYMFTNLFTLQMGLLRQYDYRLTGSSTGKNYFQTSLLFTINDHKNTRERHPSTAD